jgi:hypothetical protein
MWFAALLIRKPHPGEVDLYESGNRIQPAETAEVTEAPKVVDDGLGLPIGAALRSRWYRCMLLFKLLASWGYSVFFIHVDAFAKDSGPLLLPKHQHLRII